MPLIVRSNNPEPIPSSNRYKRIPAPLDIGRHGESQISYLWDLYTQHKELLNSNSYLLTVKEDRYACGLPLPPFQRDLCWSIEQEISFIESAWAGFTLGDFIHHYMDWESGDARPKAFSGWLIDGQQRLTTIERYWNDAFKVHNLFFSELNKQERRRFMSIRFCHYEINISNENTLKDLYNRLAFGGVPHKAGEEA